MTQIYAELKWIRAIVKPGAKYIKTRNLPMDSKFRRRDRMDDCSK